MKRAWQTGLIAIGLQFMAGAALAADAEQTAPASLSLSQVLDASARHYPEVLAAMAEQRGARGDVESALGDFDLVFEMESRARLTGFYDGRSLIGEARQPLRTWGASVYSSYAISRGDFPVYEDEYFTNTGGQLKVGVLFSILRDRVIDERRFGLTDARLALQAAELEVLLVQLGVQLRAIEAYWRWVVSGRQREVYAGLLDIALAREEALTRQVASGARAAIELTENRRNITRRRSLSLAADADLRRAANRLGLYYRDAGGSPVIPDATQLPRTIPSPAPLATAAEPEILARRPELQQLRVAAERARQRIALGENALKPQLDLAFEVAEPFGDVGPGGESRDTTDTVVGLTLTVPLERRTARGALAASRAELQSVQARQRILEDRLLLEIQDLLIELEVAAQLADLALLEVDQAEALARAEQRRFDSGASDFFLVNLREETVADARIGALQAELRQRLARAEYDAAIMDLQRLGLSGRAP